MSTYSPDLRIELITTGDQSGVWGTTTNTNLGTIVEDAISGYVTVSVLSANQAFTALNGVADEARNAMIRLTTTTTASFAVYAPPSSKQYIIWNNSGYAATIYNSTVLGNTTAAGTGISVPDGKKVVVFSDGTNFYTVDASSFFGTLAVANGGTGQTSYTDGQLLIGNTTGNTLVKSTLTAGTNISITNGSGSVTIASTAPTTSGTSILYGNGSGGFSNVTVGSGLSFAGGALSSTAPTTSGTSILYGNGSGGFSNVTIGSNLTFVGGTLSASSSGGTVTSVGGSAPVASTGGTTPVISLNSAYGDTLNPYASKTANYVLASPNGSSGTPSFRALVSTDIPALSYVSSVGGTSPVSSSGGLTPSISLASGYGDTQNPYASKTANYVLAAPNGSAGTPSFRALVASDIPSLSYAPQTSGTSILYGNGSGGFSNVTIGSNLTFSAGTLSASGGGTPAGNNSEIQFNSSGVFGASSGLYWDGKSLVVSGVSIGVGSYLGGLNTAVGNSALQANVSGVYDVAVGYQALNSLYSGNSHVAVGSQAGYTTFGGTGCTFVGQQAGYTSNTSNNTFIGYNAGYYATGESNTFVGKYAGYNMSYGRYNVILGYYDGNMASFDIRYSDSNIVFSDGNGNLAARWTNGGSWYQKSNSASWATTSDRRIKDNIVSITGAMTKILALRPVEFDYKIFEKNHDAGFIAQEYQTVFPEQITETKNVSGEIAELTNGEPVLGVQQNLVPYLVSAFQEMVAEIQTLKAEIAALKG